MHGDLRDSRGWLWAGEKPQGPEKQREPGMPPQGTRETQKGTSDPAEMYRQQGMRGRAIQAAASPASGRRAGAGIAKEWRRWARL